MKRFYLCSFLVLILPLTGWSQELHEENNTDTTLVETIPQIFTKGELHGHVRNYFMATWNHKELSDHYANALGAEIGIRTAPFHGFRLGISGLFTYNLFSSNLAGIDPVANKRPLTEQELFDVENPENKDNLDRLESAYLEYRSGKWQAQLGRFSFHSPLINPQDTRMKPYTAQGVQLQVPIHQNSRLTLAWLDHFSPRSVVEWEKAKETIGIYPSGVNFNGAPAMYPHHTATKGVAIAGLAVDGPGPIEWQGWNYWLENISNNSYGRVLLPAGKHLQFGVEGLYQFRVGNGGHSSPDTAYFPEQQMWLAGAMVSYKKKNAQVSLNYLHTGKSGRFTFPKEWGREQFFATLPRGRLEGTGDADLLVAKVKKAWSGAFSSELALAKAWLPAADDFAHNKYGAVSYWSPLADFTYQPVSRPWQGMVFRLLYVAKVSPGDKVPLNKMFYNTNYHQINFVTQINF